MAKTSEKSDEKIKIGKWSFTLPGSKIGRVIVGILLILGGMLWFLPVLGFWMMPLGFIILARDFHLFRRFNRRFTLWWNRRKK